MTDHGDLPPTDGNDPRRGLRIVGRDPDSTVGRLQRAVIAFVIVAILIYIVSLAIQVSEQLKRLSTADSDNVQWNLAQTEVEHLAFQIALEEAARQQVPDFDELRLRFDVYYSRIDTIRSSRLYLLFRQQETSAQHLARITRFLTTAMDWVDADNRTLQANIDRMAQQMQALAPSVRALSLAGLSSFSAEADLRREELAQTLFSIAGLLVVCLVLLIVLMVWLMRINRRSQATRLAAERTSSKLDSVLSASLDAILVMDLNGKINDTNGAAEAVFHAAPQALHGRALRDLVTLPDGMTPETMAGDGQRRRVTAWRPGGHRFPAELSMSLADQGPGQPPQLVAYLRDISQETEAENALMQARDLAVTGERAKADMLAVMSHEIRTPLNGMLGSLDLLAETPLQADQVRFVELMRESGALLMSHVNDVLDIARLEEGKLSLNAEPLDLTGLLRDLADSQASRATQGGNRIEIDVDAALNGKVIGDGARLRQVLLNLLDNALKFTRDGTVYLEAERLQDDDEGDGLVEFRVMDTGIGISDADQARIFEDFTTIDSSYARQTEGTGLGLGIAQRMVMAMGGRIGVESEPGEGSIFWVRLPLSPAQDMGQTPPLVEMESAPPTQPARVLLVEDNEVNRLVARKMLEVDGHSVTEAHDAEAGLALCAARDFDIVLMDIGMPGMDGAEAARQIRSGGSRDPAIPIVAVTAHALGPDIERFMAAGMDDVLIKPLTGKQLRDCIRRIQSMDPDRRHVRIDALRATSPFDPAARNGGRARLLDPMAIGEITRDIDQGQFAHLLGAMVAEFDLVLRPGGVLAQMQGQNAAREAHRLSGSAALFGLPRLRADLQAIEVLAEMELDEKRRIDAVATAWQTWQDSRAVLLEHIRDIDARLAGEVDPGDGAGD